MTYCLDFTKSELTIEYSKLDYSMMLTNIWLVQTVLIFTVKQYRKGCANLKFLGIHFISGR
jgi:hypothetical protein